MVGASGGHLLWLALGAKCHAANTSRAMQTSPFALVRTPCRQPVSGSRSQLESEGLWVLAISNKEAGGLRQQLLHECKQRDGLPLPD